MKFLRIATLVALASLPLWLARKEKEERKPLREIDSDNIFDLELSAD
jgi:hypothetical protein